MRPSTHRRRRPPARAPSRSAVRRVRGRFTGAPRGDGWVIPGPGSRLGEDVHITRSRVGAALPGDEVEVEVAFRTRRGRLEGEVRRVLDPARRQVVGEVTRDRTVVVWSREWSREIHLAPGKSAGARPGQLCAIRIRRPRRPGRRLLGEVAVVFGPATDPAAELRAILVRHRIGERFSRAALAAAEAVPETVGPDARKGRVDLTRRLILTMDPADARDHDDAIEAAPLPGGGFEIGIHIADVSHYVPAGGALDREAARRGTSVYFPERAVPMLPERLSGGICSLLPEVDRLTRSVFLRLGTDGRIVSARVRKSVIRSAAALSYEEGAHLLARPEPEAGPIPAAMSTLGRAAALLARARRARGAVDLDLPEPELETDARGNVTAARYAERTEAHRLVEDFMLAANQAVAERLRERGLPALHRVHGAPAEDRIRRFEDLLAGFGERLRPPSFSLRPAHCARLLARIAGRPEAPFLRRRLLRAMQRAVYSERPDGHFALALSDYAHFTSPIRRYPDLLVHRALEASDPDRSRAARETLKRLAVSCSRQERNAEAAERALVKRRLARFLASRLGDAFPARVAATGRFGLRVELEEVPAVGLIPMELLPGGRFRYNRNDHSVSCRNTGVRYRIGDRLRAQLIRVSPLQGDLEFRPSRSRRNRVVSIG